MRRNEQSHIITNTAASTVPSATAAVTTTSTDVFLVPCLPLSPQSRTFDYGYGCQVWYKSRITSRQLKPAFDRVRFLQRYTDRLHAYATGPVNVFVPSVGRKQYTDRLHAYATGPVNVLGLEAA